MAALRPGNFLLIALGGISLLAALWAGLSRLGWDVPLPGWSLPSYHGPLMVVGFAATLIGLERAVALKRRWGYGAPLFSGAGAVVLLTGLSWDLARGLMLAGSLVLISIFVALYRRQRAGFTAAMGLAAGMLSGGHLLWRGGQPLYHGAVIPWWAGFLVLTIAAERLELTRLTGGGRGRGTWFAGATAILLCGLGLSVAQLQPGIRVAGIGLVALAAWLLRYDLVWQSLRQKGLARFMAVGLICGYFWLLAGGLLWLRPARQFLPGPQYDAMLHCIFVGFVLSMIFAHAPIILPSVLGTALPFRKAFYSHLGLLHVSLLLRVGGGLAEWIPAQRWGGLVNVLAILLFIANSVRAALAPDRRSGRRQEM
ncbi:MAG: hypothetical protein HYX74_00555 [Acidobacteria bacterium]|nr:hypothetical protein [Acidobacteriota bacterium]